MGEEIKSKVAILFNQGLFWFIYEYNFIIENRKRTYTYSGSHHESEFNFSQCHECLGSSSSVEISVKCQATYNKIHVKINIL